MYPTNFMHAHIVKKRNLASHFIVTVLAGVNAVCLLFSAGLGTFNTFAGTHVAYASGSITFGTTTAVSLSATTVVATSTITSDAGSSITQRGFAVYSNILGQVLTDITSNLSSVSNGANDIAVSPSGQGIIVVGNNGFADMSSDGGNTWSSINSLLGSPTQALRSVSISPIVGSGTMLVVGDGGFIRTSDDNGQTWTSRTADAGAGSTNLYAASIGPDGTMLVAGSFGYLRTSTNGGFTWTDRKVAAGNVSTNLLATAIGPDGTMLVAGDSGYLRTSTDGGATWVDRSNAAGTSDTIHKEQIAFGADGTMVIVEYSRILVSVDSGVTWVNRYSNLEYDLGYTPSLWSVFFDAENNIIIFAGSSLFFSSNKGQSWERRGDGVDVLPLYGAVGLNNVLFFAGQSLISNGGLYVAKSSNVLETLVSQTGSFSVGTYALTISNLTPSTLYYVRAFAFDGIVSGSGDYVTVTTPPPFVANAHHRHNNQSYFQ
jgi:photosystem II stability/assembly factor-like uncharacterized protein